MTRRRLLNGAAAGAALSAASYARALGANDRVRLGTIGCGGMANSHVDQFVQCDDAEIIAVCDVDPGPMNHTAEKIRTKKGRRPETFGDFRKLLDMKEIDAVHIGTPDHWHAIPFIMACQAGKDVYSEKPLGHNVVEGRAMIDAVLTHKRVAQIGTQCRSSPHLQEAIKLVRAGRLGRIVETQTWTVGNIKGLAAKPDADPPAGVDYDMWLGPAPKRPFNPNRFHFNWRWFSDYGGGLIADLNVHIQDIVHLAMDAWTPRSVCATGQIAHAGDPRDTPDTLQAVYEFDSAQGPFTHTYTVRQTNGYPPDGNPDHGGRGILFCGRDATLFADYHAWVLHPEKKGGEGAGGQSGIPLMPHIRNFLDCIRSRAKTTSDVESMHHTTNVCHLANISWRVGRRLYWDAKAEKCFRDRELRVPDDEANGLLGREYRAPWKLPG